MNEMGNMTIGLREAYVAEDMLTVQAAFMIPETSERVDVNVELYLDDVKLKIEEYSTFKEADRGIGYAVIADVSGSMKEGQMTEIKETIMSLISGMRDCDRMSIMLMGNDVSVAEFSGDKEALRGMVEALEAGHEDTNLYYAVDRALSVLEADNVNEYFGKCLVVISDGVDEQVTGITLKEAESHIEKARIPVYTVAVSFPETDTARAEKAKILGSFARLSPAGVHQVIGNEGLTAETAGSNIVELTQNSILITADVKGFNATKAETYLELVAENVTYGTARDGYVIPSAVITRGQTTKTGEVVQAAEPSTAEQMTTLEMQTGSVTVAETSQGYGVFGLGIGVLILVIIAGSMVKKWFGTRKTVDDSMTEEASLAEKEKATDGTEAADPGNQSVVQQGERKADPQSEMKPYKGKRRKRYLKNGRRGGRADGGTYVDDGEEDNTAIISLSTVGHGPIEKKTITLVENVSYFLGRIEGDAPESMKRNKRVSGRHVRLLFQSDAIYIEDMGSTNGTLVNGVPIHGAYVLSDDDKISLGGSEWRINF